MRKNEVIIRVIDKLDIMYGNLINQQDVKQVIEGILYDFDVTTKETALALVNDMQDKMMLYLATKKLEGLSHNSIGQYGRCLRKFSESLVVNVEDVTTMDIRRYLAVYSQTGVKNSTIATTTDILRGFFDFLETDEYINKSPMNKIKTIKSEDAVRDPLTYEEIEILFNNCKTPRQKSLFSFFIATGSRLEEVEKLNKNDINWNNLSVTVKGKGNKTRTVYFNAKAKVHLQSYLKSREDSCDALFVTERLPINRLGRRSIQREIAKIKEQSGLDKDIFVHLLRHSYATNGFKSGMDITTIQKLLGHSNLSTTQIYTKTSDTTVEYEYKKYMNN